MKTSLAVSVTLLLTGLCINCAAMPTDRAASGRKDENRIHSAADRARVRRKVGQLNLTADSTPVEYMKKVLSSITDEEGKPRYGSLDPTTVWCFLDKDLVEGNQRSKIRSERCTTVSRYIFNWAGMAEQITLKHLPVQSGILRLFLQVIPRLLDGISTDVIVTITANLFNGSYYNSSDAIFAGEHYLNISPDSNGWVELNVTEGLRGLWPPTIENSEIEFMVYSEVNCEDKKKVPATFVDPAEISLEQENRRQRHLNLQPLLVVYISDDDVKQMLVDEGNNQTVDGESLSLGEPPQRSRRSPFESCNVEDFTIVFRDLGLKHIIAPYSYNVRQCSGSCSHTAIKRNPRVASNHAKVMASAHLVAVVYPDLYMDDPEEPCCVPTQYSSLNLLIQHQNSALELSIFPDFVVEKCGCR